MARYDKYDPISGGFRAPLAANMAAMTGNPIGVGLDVNGRVVPGAGVDGVCGVLIVTRAMLANEIVDVMTSGEIVEMTGVAAGKLVTADTTTGATDDVAASATKTPVGWTVEATRLVVRVSAPRFDAVV